MADDRKKTFTADKLNWLDCVANDRDLKPAVFKVAYAIMQHVNAETLIAWLSDETLVDITGISRSQVQRHRESLKEAGWLTWERTQIANHYTPLFDRVKAGLDDILARRAKRKELRKTRRTAQVNSPHASPAMQPDASRAMQPDASPARHIHLRANTYDLTPNNPECSASGSSGNEEPRPGYKQSRAEADRCFDRINQMGWRQAGDGDPEFDPSPRAANAAGVHWHRLLKRGYAANRIEQSAELYFQHCEPDRVRTLARWLASQESTDPECDWFVPKEHIHAPRPSMAASRATSLWSSRLIETDLESKSKTDRKEIQQRKELAKMSEAVTIERIERALVLCARLVELDAPVVVPIFERLECELAMMRQTQDTVERAKRLLVENLVTGNVKMPRDVERRNGILSFRVGRGVRISDAVASGVIGDGG